MLYQSTCVGFGYGLCAGAISWNPFAAPARLAALSQRQLAGSVTSSRCRNINLLPIDYASRPRLRDRLTLRGLTLRRNPWTYGGSVSHAPCRYSCQHSHFRYLQDPSRISLRRPTERSATASLRKPEASVRGFSPGTFSAQDGLLRPVSYYAFFKGWLLLSQPPGCYGLPTSFPT